MNLDAARSMAVQGRLYPSVILHGGDPQTRRHAAVELARLLLCEAPGDDPLGACAHCRRLDWPGEGDHFHPDFLVLEQDLRTATSVEATKGLLRAAQVAPFEARGQVFVVVSAESLSAEAANALLKNLEEPHLTAPRHFLLLTPSQYDLLPTLRSRSLQIYLGTGQRLDEKTVAEVAAGFGTAVAAYGGSHSAIDLLAAAGALAAAGDWQDPRASAPWSIAAAAVRRAVDAPAAPGRRQLLDLAQALLDGQRLRLRGITAPRILEGLVIRHLGNP